MRASGTEFRHWRALLLLALAPAAQAQFSPLSVPRLADVIQVDQSDERTDVTMLFNCSMRLITTIPASEGAEVHIQLAPGSDCGMSPVGQVAPESPPISGGSSLLTAARLESLAPGQVTLTLSFAKPERFVIAQGVDPRGLRMRLVDHHASGGNIRVSVPEDSTAGYAVNLDSQPTTFTPEAIALAGERLHVPVYVSETSVEGQRWYRLRAGPIEHRADADALLARALGDYPRAWLAIGDDAATTADGGTRGGAPAPRVERIGSDPPLPDEERAALLRESRTAMAARDYDHAIALLTKLQRQPEYPARAQAQELLGLARERAGQLTHAKAEYEEYLRLYPHGEAAERVALRLRILRAAEEKARTGREPAAASARWDLSGGFSQTGRYDNTRVTAGTPPPNSGAPVAPETDTANALFTDVDLLLRRRSDTLDWIGRLSAGYDKIFGQQAFGNSTRVSLASLEVVDRPMGLLARVGRQAQSTDGILGTFDGILVSWQFRPAWAVSAAAGYPVQQLTLAPQTQERFESLALGYAPPGAHWDGSVFASLQQWGNLHDRQGVGVQSRYLTGLMTLVTVVDYDTFYHSLNTASLVGTLQLPARFSVSFDAEHRNSPVLTTHNALIGQTVSDLAGLEQLFTPDQIYQLARDRTATSSLYSLTASKPLGERFQLTAIVSASQIGATPASGGVDAVPATGLLMTYQAQAYASNFWLNGDFNVLTLTHGATEVGTIDSISYNTRFPIGGAWRLGPRISIDRLSGLSDGSTQTSYIPSVLLDYQRGLKLLQLEVGGQLGQREAFVQLPNGTFVQTQNTTRYYVSLSYRIGFQH
ncbi:MAG: SPOR domain-containing protein [Proteobacteria bacterium]|nr:SPOR domain-containing protein [Pseudomonadota bacterium]